MDKRKGMGALIFTLCIGGFFVYAYLLMLSEWSPIVLQLSVLMAVGGILGIIAWIGYVMATTKPTSSTITSADDSPT
jgi:predicted DNA-binding transcriptional regulator